MQEKKILKTSANSLKHGQQQPTHMWNFTGIQWKVYLSRVQKTLGHILLWKSLRSTFRCTLCTENYSIQNYRLKGNLTQSTFVIEWLQTNKKHIVGNLFNCTHELLTLAEICNCFTNNTKGHQMSMWASGQRRWKEKIPKTKLKWNLD